jgi:trigger factor
MRERNLRPALQPKVEIVSFDEGAPLEFKMAVEVLPDIQPMNFADLKLERLKADVPDTDIDAALERIAQQQRKSESVDRPAEKGDVVQIDFVGSVDGTPFPGGSATDYQLELGTGSFIPGFEDQLVGAKAGEQRTVDVTFPADYGNTELAGKAAQFAVTVKEVRALAAQPVDATLATAVGMENLEELRTAIRERIDQDYVRLARLKLKRELLDRLAEQHHFPVPQGMIDIEFDTIWKQVEEERKRASGAGAAGEEGAAVAPPSPEGEAPASEDDEKLRAEYRTLAERRVRLGLLLAEVGRANSVTVTQDELNRALLDEARRYPGQERQVVEFYRNNPNLLDGLRAPVYEDKVVDCILGLAEVNERTVPPAELMSAAAAAEQDESEAPETKPETKAEDPSNQSPSA